MDFEDVATQDAITNISESSQELRGKTARLSKRTPTKINDIRGKSVPMETVDEEPAEDIAIPDAITTRSQEPQETAETAMPSNINDIRGKMIKTVPMELSGEGEYLEAAEDTVSQDVPAPMETVEEELSGEGEYLEAAEDTVSQDVPAPLETVEEEPAGEVGQEEETAPMETVDEESAAQEAEVDTGEDRTPTQVQCCNI